MPIDLIQVDTSQMPEWIIKNPEMQMYNVVEEMMNCIGQVNKKIIGSVEVLNSHHAFIENIYLDVQYREKGYLRSIISILKEKYGVLTCLPLLQHVGKFRHLGFRKYKTIGDDTYYINE